MRETNPMKKSPVVNRPSSQRGLLGMSTPETNWYSQYWLEDKPWPDLAFVIGRQVRRIARLAISAVRSNGTRLLYGVRNMGPSSEKHRDVPGARPTPKAQHPA
jgi:hypothetical protein